MTAFAITARAGAHRGQRTFVIEASDSLEAHKLALEQAPRASEISIRPLPPTTRPRRVSLHRPGPSSRPPATAGGTAT